MTQVQELRYRNAGKVMVFDTKGRPRGRMLFVCPPNECSKSYPVSQYQGNVMYFEWGEAVRYGMESVVCNNTIWTPLASHLLNKISLFFLRLVLLYQLARFTIQNVWSLHNYDRLCQLHKRHSL